MDATHEGQDSAPYEDGDYSTGTVADYDDDWSPREPITRLADPMFEATVKAYALLDRALGRS